MSKTGLQLRELSKYHWCVPILIYFVDDIKVTSCKWTQTSWDKVCLILYLVCVLFICSFNNIKLWDVITFVM